MPNFHYRAYTAAGDLEEGDIEAPSSGDAEETLWRRGLTPFDTRESRKQGSGAFFQLSRRRIPNATQLASFTREFATLEEADIPLDQSLRLLATQSQSPVLRDLTLEIIARIVDGAALSEALGERADVFGAEYINVVREGETVGKLGVALSDLADMLERRMELRARIQSALVYPALLIILAIASTAIVLGTLVPNIAPIFTDNGRPMPSGLQFILDAESNWRSIVGVIMTFIASIMLFYRMAASRPRWRQTIDRFYLQIPYAGALYSQTSMARFSRTLGSMLKAGVPLLQALESARMGTMNAYLNSQLVEAIASVRSGSHLSVALGQIEHIPAAVPQIISIGEETGKLGEMLLRIATMFEKKTHRSIERLMGLLTPLLTVLIAGVVGGLIMTVMDAVLGINELATK
jgi:general secretion pathway protein F